MPVCNNDSTLCPGYMMCEPVPLPFFNTIDEVCVVLFTIGKSLQYNTVEVYGLQRYPILYYYVILYLLLHRVRSEVSALLGRTTIVSDVTYTHIYIPSYAISYTAYA